MRFNQSRQSVQIAMGTKWAQLSPIAVAAEE
jgi:hypothetical protein